MRAIRICLKESLTQETNQKINQTQSPKNKTCLNKYLNQAKQALNYQNLKV